MGKESVEVSTPDDSDASNSPEGNFSTEKESVEVSTPDDSDASNSQEVMIDNVKAIMDRNKKILPKPSTSGKINYHDKCVICCKIFPNSRKLKRHIYNVHDGKKYKCEFCKKYYVRSAYLKEHIETIHEGKKKKGYECELCHKEISNAGN